jgi:hypothetical protein
MTILDLPPATLAPVTHDLYRDIHKALRAELFSVVTEAASLDPNHGLARAALASHVREIVGLLDDHAEHEDAAIQPVLERELPDLAERIAVDHQAFEARTEALVAMAEDAAQLDAADAGHRVHRVHLAVASFTSAYLEHQDVEERVIMPALEEAVGGEAVVGIHQEILASIPPEDMVRSLAVMLPAMNIEGRTELLGGMREGAPAEVFEGVWGRTGSVLEPADFAAVAARLGLGD